MKKAKSVENSMIELFQYKGRIGRVSFILRWLLFLSSFLLGMLLDAILWLFGSPDWLMHIGVNERVAQIAHELTRWSYTGYGILVLPSLFFVLGARISACSFVKRTRDLGVDVDTFGDLFPKLFDAKSGVTLRQLFWSSGKK